MLSINTLTPRNPLTRASALLLAALSGLAAAPRAERLQTPGCGKLQSFMEVVSKSHSFTLRAAPLGLSWLAGCQPKTITIGGKTTHFTYNPKSGLPSSMKEGDRETTYSYNAVGFLTGEKGACSHAPGKTYATTITYDSLNRKVNHDAEIPAECHTPGRPAFKHTCTAEYPSATVFHNVSDGTKFTTTVKLDAQGRPIEVQQSGGGGGDSTETHTYDRAGRVVQSVIDDPWRSGLGDGCNTLTAKYTYDSAGRLLSMDTGPGNSYGDLFIQYDARGRVTEVRQTDWHTFYDRPCVKVPEPKVYTFAY